MAPLGNPGEPAPPHPALRGDGLDRAGGGDPRARPAQPAQPARVPARRRRRLVGALRGALEHGERPADGSLPGAPLVLRLGGARPPRPRRAARGGRTPGAPGAPRPALALRALGPLHARDPRDGLDTHGCGAHRLGLGVRARRALPALLPLRERLPPARAPRGAGDAPHLRLSRRARPAPLVRRGRRRAPRGVERDRRAAAPLRRPGRAPRDVLLRLPRRDDRLELPPARLRAPRAERLRPRDPRYDPRRRGAADPRRPHPQRQPGAGAPAGTRRGGARRPLPGRSAARQRPGRGARRRRLGVRARELRRRPGPRLGGLAAAARQAGAPPRPRGGAPGHP